MNSMLYLLSILIILLIIYFLWKKRSVKEEFQNQYDDNTPPINLNVTVSPNLLNTATEQLSNITINQDTNNPASICIKLQNDLLYFNSELQRHKEEGNWTHTLAMRSYIDSINKQIGISGC